MRGYALRAGHEVSSWFMREGNFVIFIVSFLPQAPSTEYLEVLKTSALHAVVHAQPRFSGGYIFSRVLTKYSASNAPTSAALLPCLYAPATGFFPLPAAMPGQRAT